MAAVHRRHYSDRRLNCLTTRLAPTRMVYPSEGLVHGWTAEKASLDLIGYCAPLPLAEPERASAVLETYDFGGPAYQKNPHATMESVRTLVNDPGLLAAVRMLFGFNFRLWR